MLAKLPKWLTAFSLVLTIGGHWAILQSIAWIGMAVTFAQTDSLSAALSKTFDGQHPCKMCHFVSEGKKSEKKSEAQIDLKKKLDSFVFNTTQFVFASPNPAVAGPILIFHSRLEISPTPPPRSA